MALEDIKLETYYYWYYGAYGQMSDYATATSQDFGTGKKNTETMIAKNGTGKNMGHKMMMKHMQISGELYEHRKCRRKLLFCALECDFLIL